MSKFKHFSTHDYFHSFAISMEYTTSVFKMALFWAKVLMNKMSFVGDCNVSLIYVGLRKENCKS